MKLDDRKHLPVHRKDDQVAVRMDELLSFIFYQMPLQMPPSARSAQEGQVPPLFLPQNSSLFDLNSQFHFVLFFLPFQLISFVPLFLSLSLFFFLTKQYFDILLPFIKSSFSSNGAQYVLIFLKNCFYSPSPLALKLCICNW